MANIFSQKAFYASDTTHALPRPDRIQSENLSPPSGEHEGPKSVFEVHMGAEKKCIRGPRTQAIRQLLPRAQRKAGGGGDCSNTSLKSTKWKIIER